MQRRGDEPRVLTSEPALRVIMRRLREIMSEPGDGQSRLDKIVKQIAGVMVTEVCSIYLKRQDGSLELFASEGLKPGAVHTTRMKRGEGLVGRCAELNITVNEPEASSHPAFSYRPETGEEIYHSLLAVPIQRSGQVLGVLVVQNRTQKEYSDEDVEVLQATAMVVAEHLVSGAVAGAGTAIEIGKSLSAVIEGEPISAGIALGHIVLHEPRIVVTQLLAEDTGDRARPAGHGHRHAARFARRDVRSRALGRRRRAPRGARGLPHVCPRQGLGAAAARGGRGRSHGGSRGRARAERHARAHAAPERSLLARAPARPRRLVRPAPAHPRRPHHQRGRADAAAARYDPRCPHHGAGRASRLRPQAAARPRHRGRQRTEPRGRRRQGAGHRRRGAGARHRRARQCRRCGDHRRARRARFTCVRPPTWSPPIPTRSASSPADSASTARSRTCPPSPRTRRASSCT